MTSDGLTHPVQVRAQLHQHLGSHALTLTQELQHQVIEINPGKQIAFTQGKIQTDGNGFNQLNAP